MSETRYTPGAWNVGKVQFEACGVFGPDGFMVADCAIFSLRKGAPTEERCLANARLIAAAPDMVEALKAAEALMAKNIHPKPDAGPDHPWSVLQRVRAALSKAGVSHV